MQEFKSINNRNAAAAIVGNKTDLWSYRTVLKYEGELLANQNNCQHYEISAACDYTPIKRIFYVLTKKILERREKSENHANKRPTVFRKLLHKHEKREFFK